MTPGRRPPPPRGKAPLVYVAAASDELLRARWAMDQVRREGWEVALDWVSVIEASGGAANPTDVPRTRRAGWAQDALDAIRWASAVWLLSPHQGAARGAFVELGSALTLGRPTVVSGPMLSIFPALAAAEVGTDMEGLAVLRGWLR